MKPLLRLSIISIIFCIAAGCSSKSKPANETQLAPTADNKDAANAVAPDVKSGTDTANAKPGTATVKYDPRPAPRITRSDECPKGAFMARKNITDNKELWRCSCFYGDSDEANGLKNYGVLKPDGSDVLGSQFECITDQVDETSAKVHTAVCNDIHGCKTLDGRWYAPLDRAVSIDSAPDGYFAPYNPFLDPKLSEKYAPSLSSNEAIPYMTGGMDTSLRSGGRGTCVLDRTDGIPLFSDAPDAKDNFACNRLTCPCGSVQCQNGQLCKGGKCEWDKQEAIVLDDSNSEYLNFDYNIGDSENRIDDVAYNFDEGFVEACKELNNPRICRVTEKDVLEVRRFDGESCKGGKLYCHGTGNFPVVMPGAPGYRCKEVDIFESSDYDDFKAWVCAEDEGCGCGTGKCPKDAACIDGNCYCGEHSYVNGHIMPEGYKCTKSTVLECNADTCKCGAKTCHKGETCDLANQGTVSCNGVSQPSKDGMPLKDYICADLQWTCTNPAGCDCQGMVCPEGAVCSEDGCNCAEKLIERAMPGYKCNYNELKCNAESCQCQGRKTKKDEECSQIRCGIGSHWHPEYQSQNTCLCNGKAMDTNQYTCVMAKNKEQALCIDERGCKCGSSQCPYMALCSNGACVDRLMYKPIPEGYRANEGLPQCQSDAGCACGKSTCTKDRYCLNGVCFRDPYTRKSNYYKGKVLYYRITPSNDDNLEETIEYNYREDVGLLKLHKYAIQRELILNLIQYHSQEDMPDMDICDIMQSLGIKDIELHEKGKDDPEVISICSDLKYKYKTEEILHEAMSFIENCGTGEAPKDVATKYCYIRFNTIMDGHFDKHVRLEFSGWEDENFVWDEEDDEAEEEEISN